MAQSKKDLIEKLEKVWPELEIKEDHNNSDLKHFLDLANLQTAHKELQETNETLEKDKKELAANLKAKDKEINDLESSIEELNGALAKAESSGGENIRPTVKVGGHTYIVMHPVRNREGVHSPEQISENKSLAAKLAKKGSTALKLKKEA